MLVVLEGSVFQLGATSMLSSVTAGLIVLVDMTTLRSQCFFFKIQMLELRNNVVEYSTVDMS